MPSIEQKIQSYLNFSKNKGAESKGLKFKDELAKLTNEESDLTKKKSDEAESIFKNSNHELKTTPLK